MKRGIFIVAAFIASTVGAMALTLTNSLDRDYWLNIPGFKPEDLVKNSKYRFNKPDGSDQIKGRFMASGWKDGAPKDWGIKFGEKIYGYLVPPETAEYVFWICSDDGAALLLSDDADPEKKKVVLKTGTTPIGQWKYKSKPIKLEKGKPYYVELVHKQNEGGTHAMVGWNKAGENVNKVETISAEYLSSFKNGVPK